MRGVVKGRCVRVLQLRAWIGSGSGSEKPTT